VHRLDLLGQPRVTQRPHRGCAGAPFVEPDSATPRSRQASWTGSYSEATTAIASYRLLGPPPRRAAPQPGRWIATSASSSALRLRAAISSAFPRWWCREPASHSTGMGRGGGRSIIRVRSRRCGRRRPAVRPFALVGGAARPRRRQGARERTRTGPALRLRWWTGPAAFASLIRRVGPPTGRRPRRRPSTACWSDVAGRTHRLRAPGVSLRATRRSTSGTPGHRRGR